MAKLLTLTVTLDTKINPALLDLQSRSLGIADLKSANHTALERESLKFYILSRLLPPFIAPRNHKINYMDKLKAWRGLLAWIFKL
jgi:hypothetical protein